MKGILLHNTPKCNNNLNAIGSLLLDLKLTTILYQYFMGSALQCCLLLQQNRYYEALIAIFITFLIMKLVCTVPICKFFII